MPRFLIVHADFPCGRGSRGRNLARFLAIYHGRRSVQEVTSRELLAGPPLSADTLFIGLPSDVGKTHLKNVTFQHAVLFDYQDYPSPIWQQSDRDLLLSLTNTYLKPWVEPDWDYGLTMGVLPIRRHVRLKWYLQCQGWFSWRRDPHDRRRKYDVAFVGNATALAGTFHQRVEWLREIQDAAGRYSFWGGLVVRKRDREHLAKQFADLQALYYPHGRVDFLSYFRNLQRARVALAPAGNARWSYRHYEAIYAGASLVSTDFRQAHVLIPLPLENMHHVPDHDPVLPVIDEALSDRERHPEKVAENIRFLERYLQHGDYSRARPELMDRFLAQLPQAA
jgi:hypothetical protein